MRSLIRRRPETGKADPAPSRWSWRMQRLMLTPGFRLSAAAWMQAGGVWAVANARGGGEYGSQWHDAGIRDNKPNTFDDMIAVAGWLTHNGYTAPEHLALHGASNGGMMVGAQVEFWMSRRTQP